MKLNSCKIRFYNCIIKLKLKNTLPNMKSTPIDEQLMKQQRE